MEINFNLGSLKIVYDPLMDYFKKIQSNIDSNIITIRDQNKIANFEYVEIITKVQSTLKMIGLSGVVEVLQLSKDSLLEIKEAKYETSKNVKILEKVDSIFKDIAIYLQTLLGGEFDQPTKFYTQYTQLAEIIGKDVSIRNLFFPKLELSEKYEGPLITELKNGTTITVDSKKDILSTLTTAQENLLNAFPAIISVVENGSIPKGAESDFQNSCKAIYGAFNNVQKLKLSKQVYILNGLQKLVICICSPTFNDDFAEILKNEKQEILDIITDIKTFYVKLIEEINSMEVGEKTSIIKVEEETVRRILYFVIQKTNKNDKLKDMPVYKDLDGYFDLKYYILQLGNVSVEASVLQKDVETSNKIDKLLIEIKEEVTLLTSKQVATIEFLEQHTDKFIAGLKKIDEVFNTKNIPLRDITVTLLDVITRVKSKEVVFSELVQKEVSLSVLLMDYGVTSFVKTVLKDSDKEILLKQLKIQKQRLILSALDKKEELANLPLPQIDEKNKSNEERKIYLKIYKELAKEFLRSEEILTGLLREEEDNLDDIDVVFKALKAAKGIFAVMGKNELSEIIANIETVWKQVVEKGNASIDNGLLKESISWLGGISLAISAAKDDNQVESNQIIEDLITKYNKYYNKTREVEVIVKKEEVVEPAIIPEIEDNSEKSIEDTPLPEIQEEVVENIEEVVPEPELAIEEEVEDLIQEPETKEIIEFQDEIEDPELHEVYLLEAEDILNNLSVSLEETAENKNSAEEIANLRRYFHTLKGSGKMVGLKYLGECAWIVEQVLNNILNGKQFISDREYEAFSYANSFFIEHVSILKDSNKVIVNIQEFKAKFYPINPEMINNFEIDISNQHIEPLEEVEYAEPEEPMPEEELIIKEQYTPNDSNENEKELTIEEVFEEPEVEYAEPEEPMPEPEMVEEDFVLINGVEVDSVLYSLYLEESEKHVHNMLDFINSNKEGKIYIPSTFMLNAHTTSSIAKSVNLYDCASVASKLEMLSNVAIDKHININERDLEVLKIAVETLESLRTIESLNNDTDIDSVLDMLSELQEDISSRTEEIGIVHAEPVNIDMEELASVISNKLLESLDEKLNNIGNSIESLQKEVDNLKSSNNSSDNKIDDNVQTIIIKSVVETIEQQFLVVSRTLDQNKYNTKEIVDEIFNKIDNVEINANGITKSQKVTHEATLEAIDGVKKEIKIFNEEMKKKSFLDFFKSLFNK